MNRPRRATLFGSFSGKRTVWFAKKSQSISECIYSYIVLTKVYCMEEELGVSMSKLSKQPSFLENQFLISQPPSLSPRINLD
jgi:hypothetical protein